MTNLEAIKKAHSKSRKKLASKKEAWSAIRQNQKVERKNSIIDLVKSGIDTSEAIAIVDAEIKKEKDAFNWEARAYIELKKKQLQLKLQVQ